MRNIVRSIIQSDIKIKIKIKDSRVLRGVYNVI